MQGLEKLEYRGYDSAGIFVTTGQKRKLGQVSGAYCWSTRKNRYWYCWYNWYWTYSLGYSRKTNRWQCSSTYISNRSLRPGSQWVIENYLQMKEEHLAGRGKGWGLRYRNRCSFDWQIRWRGWLGCFWKPSKKALHIIEGSYAFALIDSENPDVIYVAKNKSPLLVGLGEGYNMVCSDAMAMIRKPTNSWKSMTRNWLSWPRIQFKCRIMKEISRAGSLHCWIGPVWHR